MIKSKIKIKKQETSVINIQGKRKRPEPSLNPNGIKKSFKDSVVFQMLTKKIFQENAEKAEENMSNKENQEQMR